MAALHWMIHLPAMLFMAGNAEGFESLSLIERGMLPLMGSLVLIVVFLLFNKSSRHVGVAYVIERLNSHQGHLPLVNAFVQFISVAICLVSGMSIGKEGPAVHIGATFGSQLGSRLRFPHASIETLVACGIAGAISAAFQTPLAGVLFAMEVILLEYHLNFVLPVILSSVVAFLLSQMFLGELALLNLLEIAIPEFAWPAFMACFVLAVLIVGLSGAFLHIQKACWSIHQIHFAWRFLAVGIITASLGMLVPEVLGAGYDSISKLMLGEALVTPLLIVLLLKVLLTSTSIGLGIPGGMIGPTFVIGGLAGIQVAFWLDTGLPTSIEVPLFALLGMGAMMAASFQAPLTALIAIIEMTHSSAIMLPAMLVIGLACLTVKVLLRQDSVFIERLHYTGVTANSSSVMRLLQRNTIERVATPLVVLPKYATFGQIQDLHSSMVDYVVVESGDGYGLIRRNKLVTVLQLLDLGPQMWLKEHDTSIHIDLTAALDIVPVQSMDAPASLDAMVDWFRGNSVAQVVIRLPNVAIPRLVQRSSLDGVLQIG